MTNPVSRLRERLLGAMVVVAAAALLAGACGADPNDRTSTAAAETPEAAYQAAGCASCHGQEGGGGVGPALAGHTPQQVRDQVRDPVGEMPAFDEAELPDAQLDLIVEYVEGLDGDGHAHDPGEGHADEAPPDTDTAEDNGQSGETPPTQPDTTAGDDGHPDDGHTH